MQGQVVNQSTPDPCPGGRLAILKAKFKYPPLIFPHEIRCPQLGCVPQPSGSDSAKEIAMERPFTNSMTMGGLEAVVSARKRGNALLKHPFLMICYEC